MSPQTVSRAPSTPSAFRHEALFYAGEDEFVRSTAAFIRDGLVADEPVLVVVSGHKISLLRSELSGDARRVRFADMDDVGRNPARIIPAWREFVSEQASNARAFRGIGEPIFPSRTPAEMVECERHEALLNLAFEGPPAWWLLCPYDTRALAPSVVDEAKRNHPYLATQGRHVSSSSYAGLEPTSRPFDAPLPEPMGPVEEIDFGLGDLDALRRFVATHAKVFGLRGGRVDDLVLAADELASNSVRHGGGAGRVRVWQEGDTILCEVADRGRIEDPLIGRIRPAAAQQGGLGLWLVTQLCDLVQVRTYTTGSVTRLHMRLG